MPPIHVYRAAFQEDDNDLREDQFPLEDWKQIIQIADEIQRRDAQALRTGLLDNRSPLEPARRAWFKRSIKNFHPEDYPDEVPKVFQEAECNVFGHVCPVFFAAESMTETADTRRIGRKTPNFPTMMRIVRRDDYRCQHCQKNFKITKLNLTTLFPCRKGEAQKSIIYG
jgi:hypothetical protein